MPADRPDFLDGKTCAFGACGCAVYGAGTVLDPVRIYYCDAHGANQPVTVKVPKPDPRTAAEAAIAGVRAFGEVLNQLPPRVLDYLAKEPAQVEAGAVKCLRAIHEEARRWKEGDPISQCLERIKNRARNGIRTLGCRAPGDPEGVEPKELAEPPVRPPRTS